MAFEIRSDLSPNLVGVAWLIGRWQGTGHGHWPDAGDFTYGCQIDFVENGGPFLHYLMQTYELGEDGTAVKPLGMETGFWRPQPDGTVEVSLAHPDGYAELWEGRITGGKIELCTDAVVRPISAPLEYTGGHRLYGNVESDLMWTFDRATTDVELQPYLWARLQKVT
jgi:hypothetical protein